MNDDFNFFEEEGKKFWGQFTVGIGILIYLGVLLFTGVHNFNLMTQGVIEEWRWAAILGVLALELSAIAFPLGLHYWAYETKHRNTLIAFYVVDFVLLFANTIIDYGLVAGNQLPPWGNGYLMYVAPGTPLFALFAWAILLALDPASVQLMKSQQIKAALRLSQLEARSRAMMGENVKVAIDSSEQRKAEELASKIATGQPVSGNKQLQTATNNGHKSKEELRQFELDVHETWRNSDIKNATEEPTNPTTAARR